MHGKGTCIVVLALCSSLFLAISSLSTLPQEAYKGVEHTQISRPLRKGALFFWHVEGGVANSQTIFRSSLRSSLLFAFSSLLEKVASCPCALCFVTGASWPKLSCLLPATICTPPHTALFEGARLALWCAPTTPPRDAIQDCQCHNPPPLAFGSRVVRAPLP